MPFKSKNAKNAKYILLSFPTITILCNFYLKNSRKVESSFKSI